MRSVLRGLLAFLMVLPYAWASQPDRAYYEHDFSGGMNSQVSRYLNSDKQCYTANDVRFNTVYGGLSKRPSMQPYGTAGSYAITCMHRYYSSSGTTQLIVSGSTYLKIGNDNDGTFTTIRDELTDGERWNFVTYQDIAIMGNGSDNIQKYDGATTTTDDTDGARTANILTADLGAPFAELNTGSNLDASKWYQYKVAFYDGTNYTYSTARSNPILTGATVRDIRLTDIPIGPSGTTVRYVYRTSGDASRAAVEADTTFYLVGTISDNSTQVLNDTTDDATAETDQAPTWSTVSGGTDVTPPVAEYLIIHSERLFTAGEQNADSDLSWSDAFNPDYYDPEDYEPIRPDDGDKITFLKVQLGILTVGKTNTIQKVYTEQSSDSNWTVSDPMSHIGCVAPYTAANSPVGILYLGRDGLYRFNGQQSVLISDAVTPEIADIFTTNFEECVGIYNENVYQMAYTSAETFESVNNRVLVFEMTRNAYSIDTKDVNAFCVFNSGDDYGTIYSGSSNADGYVYAHNIDANSVTVRTKAEMDEGTYDDARTTDNDLGTDPELEIAWDITIDEFIGTINDATGIIDRPDTDGYWESKVYNVNAI